MTRFLFLPRVRGLQAHPSRRVGFGALLSLFTLVLATPHPAAAQLYAKEHDYKARGAKVTVRWELDRDTVPEDGHLTATLVVTGATNPQEVVRPDLGKLPAFKERLQIADVPGPPAAADAKSVSFAYRLRPRDRKVDRVPPLLFAYFNPQAPGDDKY